MEVHSPGRLQEYGALNMKKKIERIEKIGFEKGAIVVKK